MTTTTVERTRHALHAVAEFLLAGPQYRATGTIKLQVCPGGFRTWSEPVLRVDGAELVSDELRLPLSGTTIAELAEAVGVEPGAPDGLYSDGSGATTSEVIDSDPATARWIAYCFAVGDAALRLVAPGVEPVLWPEHFDVGITIEDVSYGVSPGDKYIGEPYAYVSVSSPPAEDFFNAPFGAACSMRELGDLDGVLSFFVEGSKRAAGLGS
jgi:hypothetical protein